jgi:hypothetical protein
MPRARWAPKNVVMSHGPDPDGFSFCALCGQDAPEGVIVKAEPTRALEHSAYFCDACSRRIGEAARPS